jgi:hypothetical protein
VLDEHKRFSLFGLRRKMGSFGIFPLWGLLGAPARPPLLNPWWHGEWDGLGETGESVLKAGGIEIWSSGNEKGFFSFAAEKAGVGRGGLGSHFAGAISHKAVSGQFQIGGYVMIAP